MKARSDTASGVVKPGYGRILTFALGVQGKLVVPPFGHTEPPSPSIRMSASRAMIHQGDLLFTKYCFYCHGVAAVSSSAVPNLRYASAATHRQFPSIVLGGVRREAGMPSFGDKLKLDQVRMIEAYVLSRAAAGGPVGRP